MKMDYPTGAANPPTGTFWASEEIARLTRELDEAREQLTVERLRRTHNEPV